jgi:hypothetical protein
MAVKNTKPRLVRLQRKWDTIEGYVSATSHQLQLLTVLNSELHFNGFIVVRVEDVSEIDEPHPYRYFYEQALALRRESFPEMPRIEMESMRSAMESAGRCCSVITVHREEVDPDICVIGSLLSIDEECAVLRGISPSGDWEHEHTTIAVPDVTRLEFGGGYEEALYLVARARELQ